ncbi:MAG: NosD protein [Acidimicrobiia bacterium]
MRSRRRWIAAVLVAASVAAARPWIGRATESAPAPAVLPQGDAAWLQAQLDDPAAGLVLDIPPGEYRGPFVIGRSVHVRGHHQVRLLGDAASHVVTITAPDVTIEAVEVAGSGLELSRDHAALHVTGARVVIRDTRIVDSLHGIYIRGGHGARIERNTIIGKSSTMELVDPETLAPTPAGGEMCEVDLNQNWRGNGIHIWNSSGHLIEGNTIRDTRDGIYFSFVTRSRIQDNTIEGARYGLHYMYSDDNQFSRNRFSRSAAGAALMFSKGLTLRDNRFEANRNHRAYGLLLQTVDFSDVAGNVIAGNTLGLFVEGGSGNHFTDNIVTGNHVGLRVSDSSDNNVFAGNRFSGNLHTVETEGRNRFNRWAEDGRGNYWDGAWRLDLNRDGVADVPHRELDVFGRLRREVPQIGLLIGSPGERLLRFVHARAAIPGLPGVVDPAPLMTERPR